MIYPCMVKTLFNIYQIQVRFRTLAIEESNQKKKKNTGHASAGYVFSLQCHYFHILHE